MTGLRRRLAPGEVAFLLLTIAAVVASFCLALLPPSISAGPSLTVLYQLAPRTGWAVIWAVLALIPAAAIARPTATMRNIVFVTLLPVGVCWTAGLAWPLFAGGGSFWLPLVWALLTSLGAVVYASIPLDSPFYDRRAARS